MILQVFIYFIFASTLGPISVSLPQLKRSECQDDKLIWLFMKCGKILPVETAAAKAGFSARTGYRLQRDPQPPSVSKSPRGSR